jgi:D-amino-acid dehydrogenase
MNQRSNILIIGGGVIGVCIAYYLTAENYDVTLVEKNQICSGSSHGNAVLISCANPIPGAEPGVTKKGLRWMLDAEGPFTSSRVWIWICCAGCWDFVPPAKKNRCAAPSM